MHWYVILTLVLGVAINIFFVEGTTYITALIYLPVIGVLFAATRRTASIFIYRAILPATIGLCMVWFWVRFQTDPAYKSMFVLALRDWASIQDYFSILATLYAICIAFLLWKGLTDYDNLRTILRDEASTIQSINDYMYYLESTKGNKPIIDKIRSIFVEYISNITAGKEIRTSPQNDRFLQGCMVAIADLKTKDDNDVIALSEIMKLMTELSHIRSRRTSYIESKMSPYLLTVLVLISLALVLPFMLREPNDTYVRHTLIFTLSSFFSFMFLTLVDIDSPFDGYWQIKIDAFDKVIHHLETDMAVDRNVFLKEAESAIEPN